MDKGHHHPTINLLPWRAARRIERRRDFGLMSLAAAGVALVAVIILHLFIGARIDNQAVRNAILQQEINQLNSKIIQIRNLKKQKENLLARMDVIEQLQESRYLVVRLFESINHLLPDGVVLESIRRQGLLIKISGYAESNARISMFLKNIEASALYAKPSLNEIKTKGGVHAAKHRFQLQVTQRVQHDRRQTG